MSASDELPVQTMAFIANAVKTGNAAVASVIGEQVKQANMEVERCLNLVTGQSAKDLVEIADALCDLQYVLSGAVLEFGMGDKFVELFNEVQRSNMSKACSSLEEAEYTVKFYQDKDGTEAEIKEENGVWKVYRTADNKVLKSINYSPADLISILK